MPPALGGLLSDGERNEGQYGSYGNVGGPSGYDNNSFRFVCINNNNNKVIGGGEEPESLTCEECFTENLSEEQLENLTDVLSSRTDVAYLEGLCESLSNATLTNQEELNGLAIIFSIEGITDEDAFLSVLQCLDELGLIIVSPDFKLPSGGGDGPNR